MPQFGLYLVWFVDGPFVESPTTTYGLFGLRGEGGRESGVELAENRTLAFQPLKLKN